MHKRVLQQMGSKLWYLLETNGHAQPSYRIKKAAIKSKKCRDDAKHDKLWESCARNGLHEHGQLWSQQANGIEFWRHHVTITNARWHGPETWRVGSWRDG